MTRPLFVGLALVVGLLAPAAELRAADAIAVSNGWARETIGALSVGAAYVTIDNLGAPDRLVGASSPVAARVEVHEHRHEDGIMKMRHVPSLAVPAHGRIEMAPGGYHIMLIGLVRPLARGERFDLTLRFADAGERTVPVAVTGIAAMRGPGS